MEQIRHYIRQIAGYIILSSLLENLVAKREYAPYIRLFLNLLLVLLFAAPILSISTDRFGQTWIEAAASISQGQYLEADLKQLNDRQSTVEESLQKELILDKAEGLLKEKGYVLEELTVNTDAEGIAASLDVSVSKSKESGYFGVSYKEQADPELMLEEYLKEGLDTLIGINVDIVS